MLRYLYWVFTSEMENGTLSQMYDSLYLPIEGRLIDSDVYSFFYGPGMHMIFKFSTVVMWPVVF